MPATSLATLGDHFVMLMSFNRRQDLLSLGLVSFHSVKPGYSFQRKSCTTRDWGGHPFVRGKGGVDLGQSLYSGCCVLCSGKP